MSTRGRDLLSYHVALSAFESAARCGSFHAAALQLNMDQATVSYQIKKLEKHLNTPLLYRRRDSVILTDGGQKLFKSLERGFASIELGLAEIARDPHGNP
ncbi:Putative transcription regulator protein (fragment) [Mesorhizobium sp. ORS 3324]